jgi:hypothetical protein
VSPIRRAVVVAILLTAAVLAVMSAFRGRDGGLRSYLIGGDGRFSTSQTQAALWTLALAFVLACLLLRFGKPVGTFAAGFDSLDQAYLLLLGGPAAAWVLARRETGHAHLRRGAALPRRKGLEKNAPVITPVERATGSGPVRAGDRVRIRGANFVPAGAGGDLDALVRLKGPAADVVVTTTAGVGSAPQPVTLRGTPARA